jgi:hypothetical protein
MNPTIERITAARKLAVVGVSDRKFGGTIYKELKKRGFEVYPVHPTKETFDGDPCFDKLTSLPVKTDAAIIAVSPETATGVVDDAAAAGIDLLWFQQGKDFSQAVARAESKGVESVSGKCILMYAPPVTGIHKVHRFIANLFGRV